MRRWENGSIRLCRGEVHNCEDCVIDWCLFFVQRLFSWRVSATSSVTGCDFTMDFGSCLKLVAPLEIRNLALL